MPLHPLTDWPQAPATVASLNVVLSTGFAGASLFVLVVLDVMTPGLSLGVFDGRVSGGVGIMGAACGWSLGRA